MSKKLKIALGVCLLLTAVMYFYVKSQESQIKPLTEAEQAEITRKNDEYIKASIEAAKNAKPPAATNAQASPNQAPANASSTPNTNGSKVTSLMTSQSEEALKYKKEIPNYEQMSPAEQVQAQAEYIKKQIAIKFDQKNAEVAVATYSPSLPVQEATPPAASPAASEPVQKARRYMYLNLFDRRLSFAINNELSLSEVQKLKEIFNSGCLSDTDSQVCSNIVVTDAEFFSALTSSLQLPENKTYTVVCSTANCLGTGSEQAKILISEKSFDGSQVLGTDVQLASLKTTQSLKTKGPRKIRKSYFTETK